MTAASCWTADARHGSEAELCPALEVRADLICLSKKRTRASGSCRLPEGRRTALRPLAPDALTSRTWRNAPSPYHLARGRRASRRTRSLSRRDWSPAPCRRRPTTWAGSNRPTATAIEATRTSSTRPSVRAIPGAEGVAYRHQSTRTSRPPRDGTSSPTRGTRQSPGLLPAGRRRPPQWP